MARNARTQFAKPNPTVLHGMLELFKKGKRWTKGTLYRRSPQGRIERYCLVGGYNQVKYGTWDLSELRPGVDTTVNPELDLIQKIIREQYSDMRLTSASGRIYEPSVVGFNDFHKTRWPDIEMVLEKAIVIAEEQV